MEHQELWTDIDSGDKHLLKDGKDYKCNDLGQQPKRFIPYCTGLFDYKKRVEYSIRSGKNHMATINSLNRITIKDFVATHDKQLKLKDNPIRRFNNFKEQSARNRISKSHRQLGNTLPLKQILHKSNIKLKHLNYLKQTFNNHNIEETHKTLNRMPRSYKEIQMKLKKQLIESMEYNPPLMKKRAICFKGVYDIHIANEGELYEKAKTFRNLTNPTARAKALRYEEKDLKILKKRKARWILRDKLMKYMTLIKERKLKPILRKVRDEQ